MSDPIVTAVGNSGGFIPIEYNGRTYKLHAWTDKLRARYTRWSHQFVVDELRKLKDILTPGEYASQFSALTKDIVDGEYSFGKIRLQRVTETDQGVRALITVLLNNDAYTDEEIDGFIKDRSDEIMASLQRLNGIGGDGDDSDPKAST